MASDTRPDDTPYVTPDSSPRQHDEPRQESPNDEAPIPSSHGEDKSDNASGEKKETVFRRVLGKLGLDALTLVLMFKATIPPAIALAMVQNKKVAAVYGSLDYLFAIISVISFPILPRAQFIQQLLSNLIGVCLGAAISLLGIYCATQARAHTSRPTTGAVVYNPSQSVVSAIWLFASIWIANTISGPRPQLMFPAIIFSIFVSVCLTTAPQFTTMASGIAFVKRDLKAFLSGLGLGTFVSLLIFPLSSRLLYFKELAAQIQAIKGAMRTQVAYNRSLELPSIFEANSVSPEAQKLKAAVARLSTLLGKVRADLTFAKREVAYGKLSGDDLGEVARILRNITLPILGMSTLAEIVNKIAVSNGWRQEDDKTSHSEYLSRLTVNESTTKEDVIREFNAMMKILREPFDTVTGFMEEGLEHASIILELGEKPKKAKKAKKASKSAMDDDIEAIGDEPRPGDKDFFNWLQNRVHTYHRDRAVPLQEWIKQKGVEITPSDRNQRQLYTILYMEHLVFCAAMATLDLVRFADLKVESGSMKRNRIILPGWLVLTRWAKAALKTHDPESTEHEETQANPEFNSVLVGQSLKQKKDPERLPPATVWERFGDSLQVFPNFFGSPAAAFGLRVACATLTIGIVAYLRTSARFFVEQRLIWALIIITISMTMTAGSSTFGFFCRTLGSFFAMIFSISNYYIVDGKTGGIIPILWLIIFCEFYFALKYPRFIIMVILTIVTHILIIGYQLESRRLGPALQKSSGQPYYPIYELAPYRLATVAAGSLVAFFWTIFPYPVTARSELRKGLGTSLYLLAQFYSNVHATVVSRLEGTEGNPDLKESPAAKLEKHRMKLLSKLLVLLDQLRAHSSFTKWEPSLGGKYPKEHYDAIISKVSNILIYMSLISYSTRSFMANRNAEQSWIKDFSHVMGQIGRTTQGICSTLSVLSNSIVTGQALPPYLSLPAPYELSEQLQRLDPQILSTAHVMEPGYASFAVLQIATTLINDDMESLIWHVKALVGEVDFSFKLVVPDAAAASGNDSSSNEDVAGGVAGKRKHA